MLTIESVKNIIATKHFRDGMSIRAIEREMGIGKTTLASFCKRNGISIRSQRQGASLHAKTMRRHKGESHWTKTKPKAAKKFAEESRERMTNSNPMSDTKNIIKSAQKRSKTYRQNPTRHESALSRIFDSIGIKYKSQIPIETYIMDFLIDSVNIELDGRGHAERRAMDLVRDKILIDRGFTVIRVAQDSLCNYRRTANWNLSPLFGALEHVLPNFNFICPEPAIGGKYRVLIRNKENVSGTYFKLKN